LSTTDFAVPSNYDPAQFSCSGDGAIVPVENDNPFGI
jgi:hypothetical protein